MSGERPRSQAQLLNDLSSGVGLVCKYALRDLGETGDAEAHRAVVTLLEGAELDEELRHAARICLEQIEARLGFEDQLAEFPAPSGRFIKPDLSTLKPPPLMPLEPGAPAPAPVPMLAADDLVRRAQLIEAALQGVDKTVEPREYGYRIEVLLISGRKQFVRIAFESSDFESDKVIVIYTVCGPARPDHYRWALEMNRKLDHGKLALGEDAEGEACFLLMQTLVERSASVEEVRKAILTVAEKGDRIEALLTDSDVH